MEQISKRLMNWATILEPGTRAQAERTASMPFIYPHVALMPDAHLGKGATVGSVIPTLGAIMPAAVGVDIGCGMIAHRTSLHAEQVADPDLRHRIHGGISSFIPLSAGRYNHRLYSRATERRVAELESMEGAQQAYEVANWDMQLGSLGSGNHFIEVSLDEEDRVWLFLHSGSRGVGNKLANRHIKIAQERCDRWWISLPDPDLAYLPEGDEEFGDYIRDLRWAQHFALLNRREMMHRVEDTLHVHVSDSWYVTDRIECHHNYTERERHFSKEVWLSRKGAIDASEGRPGLIPGSMGTASYVVTGLGNRLALNSSPHGAGRNYSRSAARKTFTRAELDAAMAGIEWGRSDAFLDEIPGAYKPVEQVMADAADLVKVEHTLRQVINVKGD